MNPSAGAGAAADVADEVAGLIAAAGPEVERIDTTSPAHTTEAAAADGTDRIIALGGDGMFHHVLQGVAGTGRDVGLVPVGTGNDLARALDLLRDDLTAAVDVALGPTRPYDAVRTDAGWFATIAALGFAATVNARGNAMRWPKGDLRYTIATLLELPRLATETVDLDIDGASTTVEATFLAIANTRFFGGGMAICPDADPDDGLLDVGIVGPVGRIELLRLFPRVFSGGHVDHPAFSTLRGHRVIVRSRHDIRADGETLGPAPMSMEAVPGAFHLAS